MNAKKSLFLWKLVKWFFNKNTPLWKDTINFSVCDKTVQDWNKNTKDSALRFLHNFLKFLPLFKETRPGTYILDGEMSWYH